ncbi:MAG: helix-turn-helix transcriptional regulator, partial [Erythrobacter sp.]
MAHNVVELRTPQGRESLEQLLESVTITCPEDIHDAAVNLARIAQERGMQIAVCDDISSKEP